MKKFSLLLIILLSVIALTGCGKKEETKKEESEPTTPAAILAEEFESTIKDNKSIVEVAEKLSENKVLGTSMVVEEKKPKDFLSGFDEKIKNFKNAAVIQPMIGSIPFVAYVFETDDAEELEKELKEKANPRWNICTEADETIVKVVDNYVFFIMSPNSFEE